MTISVKPRQLFIALAAVFCVVIALTVVGFLFARPSISKCN